MKTLVASTLIVIVGLFAIRGVIRSIDTENYYKIVFYLLGGILLIIGIMRRHKEQQEGEMNHNQTGA
jgi:uncharacterized membrane protein HdeD (DUF308 family)